jgi:hypothetical protein
VAKRRQTGEQGVGDTLARLLKGVAAGKASKVLERITGKSCGCRNRQAWLNQRYNYLDQ